MRLYLDDDTVSRALVSQLRLAGHDVQIPADIGNQGEADPVHLTYAVQNNRVTITYDYADFEDLHDLVKVSGGAHPGLFIIRRDQDRRRHLSPAQVVRAIANLVAAGVAIKSEFIVLNHWQ